MHYKNLNFLQYGCPGGTQLPDLQPAVFLFLPERSLLAFLAACRKQCPGMRWLSGLDVIPAVPVALGSCLFLAAGAHTAPAACVWLEQMLQRGCAVSGAARAARSAGAGAGAALQIPGASPGCSSLLGGAAGDSSTQSSALTLPFAAGGCGAASRR